MADRYIEEFLVSTIGSKCGNDNLGTILLLIGVVCMGLMYSVVRIVVTETGLGSMTYFASRFIVSVILLIALNVTTSCLNPSDKSEPLDPQFWWNLIMWGTLGGIASLGMFLGAQYGEMTQSVAQASFIVAMYVVVVPLAELLLSNFIQKLSWRSWLAITLDIPGILLISGCADTDCFDNFQWGILWLVLAMLSIVADTIISGRAVPLTGSMPLVIFGDSFCAIVGLLWALSTETEQWSYPYTEIRNNWYWIVITALLGVMMSLCITVAFAFTSTTRVAIVTSTESLSGAFFGYLILGETMTKLEGLGASLMFVAVLVELLPCECFPGIEDSDVVPGHETEGDEVSEDVGLTATESTPLMDRQISRTTTGTAVEL